MTKIGRGRAARGYSTRRRQVVLDMAGDSSNLVVVVAVAQSVVAIFCLECIDMD